MTSDVLILTICISIIIWIIIYYVLNCISLKVTQVRVPSVTRTKSVGFNSKVYDGKCHLACCEKSFLSHPSPWILISTLVFVLVLILTDEAFYSPQNGGMKQIELLLIQIIQQIKKQFFTLLLASRIDGEVLHFANNVVLMKVNIPFQPLLIKEIQNNL